MVEVGTSADGTRQLISDLKLHKDKLDDCLVRFTELLQLLVLVVDKYMAFSAASRLAADRVNDLERHRAAAVKLNPSSEPEFVDVLSQLQVQTACCYDGMY
mgnify:CR=1 FL=1